MTDDVTVSVDGVTVAKTYESERFPVPAIAFEVSSERGEGVALAIVDDVPEAFPMDRIGFHPDYESDNWTAYQDHRVRYERTLDARESVTTVYGIRLEDDENPETFLDEPTVQVTPLDEAADAADADTADEAAVDDIVPSETTGVVRDALAGGDSVPGLDADVGSAPDDASAESGGEEAAEPAEPSDAAADADSVIGDVDIDEPVIGTDEESADDASDEPGDAGTPTADAAHGAVEVGSTDDDRSDAEPDDDAAVAVDDEGATSDEPDAAVDSAPAADHGVAEALAAEIRAGDVADGDLDALRDALGTADGDGGDDARHSVEVQVEHLQGRVSEIEAYADALEAFIDGDGTARELLEDLRADVETVEARTDAIERDVETLDREFETLRGEVHDLAADADAVEDLADDLDRLRGDLDALDERVVDVEDGDDHVADVREDIAGLENDIEEIRQWRDQLTDVFGG